MASVSNPKGSNRMIQWKDGHGKRHSFRLGKLSKRQAETVCKHVEVLNAANMTNSAIEETTARWLAGIDGTLRAKLVAHGLISGVGGTVLKAFLTDYLTQRNNLVRAKQLDQGSLTIDELAVENLLDFFGADRTLRSITEGDCVDFRNWLLISGSRTTKKCGTEIIILSRRGLAESTTRKRCAVASRIFRYARRKKYIDDNPFDCDGVPRASIATTKNAVISPEDAMLVMDQLPTTEWKVLFAMSRWGGLRIGSEARLLKWSDIQWAAKRIVIHSPKTDRYSGHESRCIPMYSHLIPLLQQRQDEANPSDEYVLPFLQCRTDAALRKPLIKAIEKAGLIVWPALWHSMRKTRQNELKRLHDPNTVCYWMGNSSETAAKHYFRPEDADYAKALDEPIVKTAQ